MKYKIAISENRQPFADVLQKHFAAFTGKLLSWSPFYINLKARRPAATLKRDSNADVFL